MRLLRTCWLVDLFLVALAFAEDAVPPFPPDSGQQLERTCFQTGRAYTDIGNLRSDVAIVYGIDAGLPERIRSWRDHGYRVHVMTGVSWGQYQDYLDGRFDGVNHTDEAQTDRHGNLISHGHGGTIYYMCPGTNYGKFLSVGIQRALAAGTEAIHLEEPEFWVRGGYSGGFQREWKNYYSEDWQPPHSSVDAQWRASKLKYFLYRRALQQVFDYVQDYNQRTGRHVRCYVATHSLLNYAHWRIVSSESSLARLKGCDGYIAQVWTGTARTPNVYRGVQRSRTFETAFLEYGAMQNLVRATGRTVWYLNDPIEDNPNHDWNDYKSNWESTLVASLFQPEVSKYEVAPWPERIFGGRYPQSAPSGERKPIPPPYATELQIAFNALNDLSQKRVAWDCGTTGIGVLVGDSLMFERGDPDPSDGNMSHIYGLALPLLKRGMPVTPVQLENLTVPHYLDGFRILLLTYHGMKPLSPEVHTSLADWVKRGGGLVVCDDDQDPYNGVREWWNSGGKSHTTPREHLFETLGLRPADFPARLVPPRGAAESVQEGAMSGAGAVIKTVGHGAVIWQRENPAQLAQAADGDVRLSAVIRQVAERVGLKWRETNYLLLRRGPYVVAAGLDESIAGGPKILHGRFVNLLDPDLRVHDTVPLSPASRYFLLDLETAGGHDPQVLASACKALPASHEANGMSWTVEGVAKSPAVVLVRNAEAPHAITLDGKPISNFDYSTMNRLLWIRFTNESRPRELRVLF